MHIRLSWFSLVFGYTPSMHVIVDIRTTSPQETTPVRAGLAWARLWRQYKPDDTLSLLLYEHQEHFEGFSCIVVPQPLGIWWKKNLKQKNTKQVFRCVNFSSFAPYDASIPTISHVWSNAMHLYGEPGQSSLMRRYTDWLRKQIFHRTTTLIVPDIQIGRELVELYDVWENQIEIIPYLPLSQLRDTAPLQMILTPHPYFIYDGGYGNEANILTLLAAWERYRHDWGKYELLLVGSAGEYLSSLTQMIRSLDIAGSVRYLGPIDDGTLHTLYKKAKGWIYTWPYYSAGSIIELAVSYELPMLLSDIVAFQNYDGLRVHPNHTSDIAKSLSQLETIPFQNTHPHHERAYVEAYEKILAKRK